MSNNKDRFAINVDIETLNEFGRRGARGCNEESHKNNRKHYDITIHRKNCKSTNIHAANIFRYWIKNINNYSTAIKIANKQRELWRKHLKKKDILIRNCMDCNPQNI
ncbi:MAG: hypothetical protein A2474_01325 [Elusimicrobia bacterium RIFOXYC2_FULL_34_12]|nr:MAG: hypothetical protein A2474_01325 [Elusimicrobia bacterium RIFOXYC2_FULL_34_12]OGS38436.1 MAG: hypothetical protein A2551_02515 [Elusimicrobia bacterium RIFOXYD2_FULL_34_30]